MSNMTDLFMSHPGLNGQDRRYMVDGFFPANPTTPSTQQAALGTDVTAVRVFDGVGLVRMPEEDGAEPGFVFQHAAADDVVLVNEAGYLLAGQERYIDRIASVNLRTNAIELSVVAAASAADGAGATPTNAAIEAAVGLGRRPWMRLYGCRIRRTADAVIAVTWDFTRRPLGVYRADAAKHTSLR